MPGRRPPRAGTAPPQSPLNGSSAAGRTNETVARTNDITVVGIGASAGGLDACRKLLAALPPSNGMAFILVQQLDPTHESMMVDLLADHTHVTVHQIADGMPIERDHLYVVPPGTYVAVSNNVLHLSAPNARHGARMPLDFLLRSLAERFGRRAIAMILSGTGTDGSLGLIDIKAMGGIVIVQEPEEPGFDGMPLSAISTGAVGLVLPVAEIPAALIEHNRRVAQPHPQVAPPPVKQSADWLPAIVDLLRAKTPHDFRLYEKGALRRRIEHRMALRGLEIADVARYFESLRNDKDELDLLAADLLINVTSFFRDAAVFALLGKTIVPDLVRNQPPDQPLRIWVSGCSSGEEAYSLAMLFLEAIAAAKLNLKLLVFASDADPDAIASARNGFYSNAIERDVSPVRLGRFFTKEENGYRVAPDLRTTVTFTVQDVLADPPFSRLDLVSCRNLLIYLGPEAQTKVFALFRFALREGGFLLLGTSETIGQPDTRFEVVSKPERIYRHIGRARVGDIGFSGGLGGGIRLPERQGHTQGRQAALAEFCRRHVLETYAPAAVLINHRLECLYSLGPTDRYLRLAPGHPTHDLLAMVQYDLRIKLRAAIQKAIQDNTRVVAAGGTAYREGNAVSFNIDVRPLVSEGEGVILICFADAPALVTMPSQPVVPGNSPRVDELEQELAVARTELQDAIRNLEYSSVEQRAVNDEALSINEEYQSTNEELLTSKEELQSLNVELTALNSQLQETLERQRTTANDLQNVLYSTDVATLFLDRNLNIRFYTPATKALFTIIASDVGRPLADLHSLSDDRSLADDARTVLANLAPIDREIATQPDVWFTRRILPYRTSDDDVEGVVITFSNITERKRMRVSLETAKGQAERATVAKSRFLATASHELRQPLQTFALLQGLLARTVEGEKAKQLVARLGDTLGAMTGMLDALLDINRIDAGTVRAEIVNFSVNSLLDRLRNEFTTHARAKSIELRVVPCGASVHCDPRVLEQMLRIILSNALKYTEQGRILIGCRRHLGVLSIEIWDTGIGIPEAELQAIFEEYYQVDNGVRERTRGRGLGLAIVRRLGDLLSAQVRVRSQPGKGSVFTVDIKLATPERATPIGSLDQSRTSDATASANCGSRTGVILVVEDDPEARERLEMFLRDAGHQTASAPDGAAALKLVLHDAIRPDLIVTNYNLPNDMDGVRCAAKLRAHLDYHTPVVILTGDISTGVMHDIARQDCVQIKKPLRLSELTQTIQILLAGPQPIVTVPAAGPGEPTRPRDPPVIFVIDDDDNLRGAVRMVLEDAGRTVRDFASCEAFLAAYRPDGGSCVLIDAYLPGMKGLDLLKHLRTAGHLIPAIMITGDGDVPMAVQAMKAGACDFIQKPISREELLGSIERALEQPQSTTMISASRETALACLAGLTARQRQILDLVLAGYPSKNIAADLGISQRTVDNHRAAIMRKTGSKSMPALVRTALAGT